MVGTVWPRRGIQVMVGTVWPRRDIQVMVGTVWPRRGTDGRQQFKHG